jgi:hypothetical protein
LVKLNVVWVLRLWCGGVFEVLSFV